MIKLNNKGFVATSILYTTFIFFVIIILALLKIIQQADSSFISESNNIKKYINSIVPYNIDINE